MSYIKLVKRYAKGRKIFHCGEAYIINQGSTVCSPRVKTRDEVCKKAFNEIKRLEKRIEKLHSKN